MLEIETKAVVLHLFPLYMESYENQSSRCVDLMCYRLTNCFVALDSNAWRNPHSERYEKRFWYWTLKYIKKYLYLSIPRIPVWKQSRAKLLIYFCQPKSIETDPYFSGPINCSLHKHHRYHKTDFQAQFEINILARSLDTELAFERMFLGDKNYLNGI